MADTIRGKIENAGDAAKDAAKKAGESYRIVLMANPRKFSSGFQEFRAETNSWICIIIR